MEVSVLRILGFVASNGGARAGSLVLAATLCAGACGHGADNDTETGKCLSPTAKAGKLATGHLQKP